jgi:hypothetical protein
LLRFSALVFVFGFSPVRARDANGWLRFSSVRACLKKFERTLTPPLYQTEQLENFAYSFFLGVPP